MSARTSEPQPAPAPRPKGRARAEADEALAKVSPELRPFLRQWARAVVAAMKAESK